MTDLYDDILNDSVKLTHGNADAAVTLEDGSAPYVINNGILDAGDYAEAFDIQGVVRSFWCSVTDARCADIDDTLTILPHDGTPSFDVKIVRREPDDGDWARFFLHQT